MGDMADWLADNAAAMGEDDLDAWSDERGAPYPFRQVGRTMDDAMEEVDGCGATPRLLSEGRMTKTPGTRPRTRWKLNEWGVRVLKVGGVTAYLSDHTGGHWGLTVLAGELDLSARRGDFGRHDVDGIKAKTPELACKKAEALVWRHVTRHLKMLEKAQAVLMDIGYARRGL